MSIRIAIFDDNKNVRNSFILLLNTDPAFKVVGNFSAARNCVENVLTSRPDLILMDLGMPGVNGLSYKMIAHEWNIRYKTVRSHIKKIYEKLHVSSLTEVVAKAINQNIV
jgi:DNA-binding NarL/FixJ family response regulator